MPIYEFRCERCGARFEERRRAAEGAASTCTACGSQAVSRVWSPFSTAWRPSSVSWHRVGARWGEKPPKRVF